MNAKTEIKVSAEKFLELIGIARYCSLHGKARTNLAKRHYAAYREALKQCSWLRFACLVKKFRAETIAVMFAAKAKDGTHAAVIVEEFEDATGVQQDG